MDEFKIIAHIRTDFPEKFGIPRQSGLVKELTGRIVFEKDYRTPDAVKGLSDFSHLWLLWKFEVNQSDTFNATVRPPRLGGNETVGVFATRSPFRPNPIGLSSVKLDRIEYTKEGPVLHVSGIDLRDNTPIYDIKPYLAYVDSHPDACDGFAALHKEESLTVCFPEQLLAILPECKRTAAIEILRQDPRPHYQNDAEREYGVSFAGFNIGFTVSENVLKVSSVIELDASIGKKQNS